MFYHDEEKQRIHLTFGNIVRIKNAQWICRSPNRGTSRKLIFYDDDEELGHPTQLWMSRGTDYNLRHHRL